MKTELKQIIEPLLIWYQEHHRDLPWRRDKNPYRIWVSEIMLQQTRVEAVKEYFERFMKEIPTVEVLAKIEEQKLLKLWEGLGYYNRARNLQKAAKEIITTYQGKFPGSYEELLKLPGIGSYTAGAIASISFQEKVPAVDGNVLRVMTRILGSYEDIGTEKTKNWIRDLLLPILPSKVDLFNQALMELGATVCIPNGDPLCQECPFRNFCIAHQQALVSEIPVKEKKLKRKIEHRVVLLITDEDRFVLEKRKEQGLLAGMYQFPNFIGEGTSEEVLAYLSDLRDHIIRIDFLKDSKHIFSHVEWHMKNVLVVLDAVPRKEEKLWVTMQELNEKYPLPSAFINAKKQLKKRG